MTAQSEDSDRGGDIDVHGRRRNERMVKGVQWVRVSERASVSRVGVFKSFYFLYGERELLHVRVQGVVGCRAKREETESIRSSSEKSRNVL